jgi:uncharacterized membrane protein
MRVEKLDRYLKITGEGERNDFTSIAENSAKIFELLTQLKYTHLLLDYSAVNFNIPLTQGFNMVRYYEQKFPAVMSVVVAVILNKQNIALGKLWDEVAASRGFIFKTFSSFQEGEDWLLSN